MRDEDGLSSGERFLLTPELASSLIPHLAPSLLKAFVQSSQLASTFFHALSSRDVDRYAQRHLDPFPQVASCYGHFISSGCTCIMILASSHNLHPTDFTGDHFSDKFWHGSRGQAIAEETRGIERAVRLGTWCNHRKPLTALEFLARSVRKQCRDTAWWQKWLPAWCAASNDVQQDFMWIVKYESARRKEARIAIATTPM